MVNGGKPGVDSKDKGKHTGRNDLLFVEKMTWMDERVLLSWLTARVFTPSKNGPRATHPSCPYFL